MEGCSTFTRLASSICESYCPRLSIDETGNCAVASRYGTAFPHKVTKLSARENSATPFCMRLTPDVHSMTGLAGLELPKWQSNSIEELLVNIVSFASLRHLIPLKP